jgi:hypothetical protein
MLCGKCGCTNLEDAKYCEVCGAKLEGDSAPPLDPPVGDVPCPHCGGLNEAIAEHCRFCGVKIEEADGENAPEPLEARQEAQAEFDVAGVVEADEMRVLFGTGEESTQAEEVPADAPPVEDEPPSMLNAAEEDTPAAPAGEHDETTLPEPLPEADDVRVATPYASTVAHPKDIVVMVAADNLPPPPIEFDGEETAANALSASLDSMIGELLDVEINEPVEPDFIPPDESSFPPRTGDAYRRKIQIDVGAVVLQLVVTVTFFVCGISIGLWTSYFLM